MNNPTEVEEVDRCPTLGGRGMSVYDLFRSKMVIVDHLTKFHSII